jgi:Fe-S-cluster containining protein
MQVPLIVGYAVIIAMFLYLTNRVNLIELWRGRKKFECQRHGHCCRLLVQLTKKDIARLEKAGYRDFYYKKRFSFYLKQKNGWCPWVKIENGIGTCTIYKYRPRICRTFPRKRHFGLNAYDIRCEGKR